MTPKISVIIPAYNAEKTLRRCLDSVFASDFLDSMEIILVNDGSRDHTLQIAEEYKKYPNFVLIDQPNGGTSFARMVGINASRGEYLAFVDADDYIAPDMMSKMYNRIQSTKAQVCVCSFCWLQEEQAIVMFNFEGIETESNESAIKRILNNWNPHLWNKIFDRKLINQEDLRKTVGISYSEDALLSYFALRKAKTVAYLAESLYFYVSNPESVTRKLSVKSLINCHAFAHEMLHNQIKSDFPQLEIDSKRFYLYTLIGYLRMLARKEQSSEIQILRNGFLDKIKSLTFHEILSLRRKSIAFYYVLFSYVLLRFNLFDMFYYLCESDMFTPCRKLWRFYRYQSRLLSRKEINTLK